MPGAQQVIRILRLAKKLQSPAGPFTTKQLAEYFGVSKATMQRDIDKASGIFNISQEDGPRRTAFYRIDGAIEEMDALRLTRSEVITLHAALSSAQAVSTVGSLEELAATRAKIALLLKDQEEELAKDLAGSFASQQRGYIAAGDRPELTRELIHSISTRVVCRMSYSPINADTPSMVDIRPLRLVWHRQAMYVAASPIGSDEIHTYAVHRINVLEPLDETFTEDLQGRVDKKLDSAFGIFGSETLVDVKIRFDAFIAKTVMERTYHPTEVKTLQDDGGVLYEIQSGSQWEILSWVLSFGPWAELIEPATWRKAIAERVRSMQVLYDE